MPSNTDLNRTMYHFEQYDNTLLSFIRKFQCSGIWSPHTMTICIQCQHDLYTQLINVVIRQK